jgi:hypothetical protein
MFCQTCGFKLRSTARFCNHCGKAVQERFGSAVLKPSAQQTSEHQVGQTAEHHVEAPTTPELHPKPPTDQIQQRGTDRQPLAKATAQEAPAPEGTTPLGTPPGAITNVSRPYPDDLVASEAPLVTESTPKNFTGVARAATLVEDTIVEEVAPIELSTLELQRDAANKPFFTQLLTPGVDQQPDMQHRRLARAVPLVLLALIVLLLLAYWAAK